MKRWLGGLLLAATLNAQAGSYSTDWSDVWYNPSEPGWGLTTFQQADTIFAAIYTYGTNGVPYWFVASGMTFQGLQGSGQVYSGALYETRGNYFGGAYVPANALIRQVGTLNITFSSISTAIISYAVDGVPVSKTIQRYAFKNNSMTGSYIGASVGTYSGCASNGYLEEPSIWTVNHSASGLVTMVEQGSAATCTYSGQYVQTGKFGQILNATMACTNGTTGLFSATEIDPTLSGITARALVSFGGNCQWLGRVGGVRRN